MRKVSAQAIKEAQAKYPVAQPTPWYGNNAELGAGNGTMEPPPLPTDGGGQPNSGAPAGNELKNRVFGTEGVDEGMQDSVTQMSTLVKDLGKNLYGLDVSDEDAMRVSKESLKSLAQKIAELKVEPMIKRIDAFLDKDTDKAPKSEEPKEPTAQERKATPPWGGAAAEPAEQSQRG